MAAHVHGHALKHVASMRGMQRIDLRVFGALQVIKVVALDGLVEERKAEQEYKAQNNADLCAVR